MIGVIALLRLAGRASTIAQLMRRSWPLWIPVGVALLSVLWSGEPDLSLRRSSALVLTTLFALFIVSRFDTRAMVNCLLAALLLYCAGSVFLIIFMPNIGVHAAADTRFVEHVGAWRGLSPFKNDFGRMVAFAGALFVGAAVTRAYSRGLWMLASLLAAVLVIGSRSGQAVALFLICMVVVFYIALLQRSSPRSRSSLVLMTFPAIVLISLVADIAISFMLEALAKNSTLTGRSAIWAAVIEAIRDNLLFGGGYGTGWYVLINSYMQEVLGGREIGHAHNGYLNLIVDIGLLGLLVVLGFLVAVGYRVYQALVDNRNSELVMLASIVIVLVLAGNWVGSFLMKYNSIFWVLLICTYCKLSRGTEVPVIQAITSSAIRRQPVDRKDLASPV
jgi:O-antigen ligase